MKKNETWNLDDIVTLDDYVLLLESVQKRIPRYGEFFTQFTPEMSTELFKEFLVFDESIDEDMIRLGGRVMLMESADIKDKQAMAFKTKLKNLDLELSSATIALSQWLKGNEVEGKQRLDDDNTKRLFAVAGDLEYGLQFGRKAAGYSLPQKEELIIRNKDSNGVGVVNDLYNMTTSDFRFQFCPPGKKVCTIDTIDELNRYTYSADPAEREEAFRARFEQYEKNIEKLFVAYQAIVKNWVYECKLRGYASPISMRNVDNHLNDKSIETLLGVCKKNTEVFQRLFRWKAKQLGQAKLRRVDFYAPLNTEAQTIELEPSIQQVLQNFREFSPQFSDYAKLIIDKNHVDFLPRPNKRSGAFCMSIGPKIAPYVMTNFAGRMTDKFTIAHELGHGVHMLYASGHSIGAMHANLPLMETASTFGEMVVFEKTLLATTDNQVKKQLLAEKLFDSYATIMRQNYFTKFEIDAHAASEKEFSIEVLNELWLDNLAEQFGDSVEIDEMFQYEWAYIPHIFSTPFYCYAYSFGELLSMALYKRYKDEGDSFVGKIEQILAAGGSQDPAEVLGSVGIDMEDPEFWQGSFAIVEDWLKQLEEL